MLRLKNKKIKQVEEKKMERAMGVFKKTKKVEGVKTVTKLNLGRWTDKSHLGTKVKSTGLNISKGQIEKFKRSK